MKYHVCTFAVFFFSVFLLSCDKLDNDPDGEVEIFLLASYETIQEPGSAAIEESTVLAESVPFLPYDGIASYHSSDHTFKLTDAYRDTVVQRQFPVSPTAFGVYANGTLIYTGYFVPAYSSMGCAWTTIDPLFVSSRNRLEVRLGYPGPVEGVEVPDRRNDPRILAIFRRDGKLK